MHAFLIGMRQTTTLADGSIKQEQCLGRPEFLQEAKNEVHSQGTCLRQPEVCRLSRKIADNAIVGPENGAPEKRAFHGYLNIVPIHHQPFIPPAGSPTLPGKASQSIPLTEDTPMEQLPFQVIQPIAIADPLECRLPRVPPILQKKEILSGLVYGACQRFALLIKLGSGHERLERQQS